MPLFYYAETLLTENAFDVLRIDAQYWKDERLVTASLDDRIRWITDDIAGSIRAGLDYRPYDELAIVTKSISTAALVNLLSSGFSVSASLKLIWLTPLIGLEEQRVRIAQIEAPGLIVIGTNDSQYDESMRAELSHLSWCVVTNADHSMDIPGDTWASMKSLEAVVKAIAFFLFESRVDRRLPDHHPTA